MSRPPLDLRLGDILTLKKPHPCGGRRWEVVRLGMDIGVRCTGCGRRVLIVRSRLERQVKGVERSPGASPLAGTGP